MDVWVVERWKTGVIINVDRKAFLFSHFFWRPLEVPKLHELLTVDLPSVLIYSLNLAEFGGLSLHFLVCAKKLCKILNPSLVDTSYFDTVYFI